MNASRTLRSCARGTATIETLLAFVPVFTLFLGIIQYTLLAAAHLVVQHAAVAGVRSASVVLTDDPAYHDNTPELSIGPGSEDAPLFGLAPVAAMLLDKVPAAPTAPTKISVSRFGQYGPRMIPVRNAVYTSLAAIVPPRALAAFGGSPGFSVFDALGDAPEMRLMQAAFYLPITTAITFPVAPGASEHFEDFVQADANGLVTVRVAHLATCTIPLVARIMCSPLGTALFKHVFTDTPQSVGALIESAPGGAFLPLLGVAGARTTVLQAEASMPLQSAPYPYPDPET